MKKETTTTDQHSRLGGFIEKISPKFLFERIFIEGAMPDYCFVYPLVIMHDIYLQLTHRSRPKKDTMKNNAISLKQ